MKHLQLGTHTVEQCAVRVLMTCVSRPTADRAIFDGGSKSMSGAVFADEERGSLMGHIIEFSEARFSGASEEHAHVDVSHCEARPQIGDRVRVIPVHPCPTFNEHDLIAAVRGDRVEAFWPVHARGAIR
jgi:D-serine deaminase-like pyridoxal phosphate-dependent protein